MGPAQTGTSEFGRHSFVTEICHYLRDCQIPIEWGGLRHQYVSPHLYLWARRRYWNIATVQDKSIHADVRRVLWDTLWDD